MSRHHAKLYVLVFLTAIVAPLVSATRTDPNQAQTQSQSTVMDKLSPLDKTVLDMKASKFGLTPEEQEWHAKLLYKMKTGAPLDPGEQAVANRMSPTDKDFLRNKLYKYDTLPVDDALKQLIQEGKAKADSSDQKEPPAAGKH